MLIGVATLPYVSGREEKGSGDDPTAPPTIEDGLDTIGSSAMSWTILIIAGLFEIGWAIGLKYTEGFTRLWPTVGTVVAMVISVALLGVAMKTLPVGTAYAVWTGIGTVGTVILGMVLLGDAVTVVRILCIMLIVSGIAGLKYFS
ncbi:SugE-like protein [Janthinobacterium sp. Marseille]|nr:SugE-like protein [Janthinobacterium sp. Marseille]